MENVPAYWKARLTRPRSSWHCSRCYKPIEKNEESYKVIGVSSDYGDGVRFHKACKPAGLEVIENENKR